MGGYSQSEANTLLASKADSVHTHAASDVSGLSTVATSGSYTDLSNKPTIPTVNNKTLTIQKNGTNVAAFTANSSSNVTANITVPTKTSELTNDSGFLTSHQSLSNYVTLNGAQTISGAKTFSESLVFSTPSETLSADFNTFHGWVRYNTVGTSNYKNYNSFLCWNTNKNDNTIALRRSVGILGDTTTGATIDDIDTAFAFYDAHIRYKYINFTENTQAINDGTANAFRPITTNVTDLGGSSNVWKNVYASNFYGNITGNVTGNASSATEFSANKSVTLTGHINGTASSKAGWTVQTALKNCYFHTSNSLTSGLFKVASGVLSGGWNRYEAMIRFVEITSKSSETLRIFLMLDENSNFQNGIAVLMDSETVPEVPVYSVVYKNDTGKILFEIYRRINVKNHQVNALVLYETTRSGITEDWNVLTMYNDTVVSDLPSDYAELTIECEKNYFYDGVAWGLDKSNWWKETQVMHQGEAVDIVNNLSAERVGKSLYFMDASHFWAQYIPVWGTDGSFRMELGISNWTAQGAQGYWTVANRIAKNFGTLDFYTSHPNGNLGTATNPWKTVNGINPGALSLPSTNAEPISTQGWDFANYSPNSFTAPGNGYISVGMFADSIQIANDTRNMGLTATKGSDGYASLNLPCCSGDTIRILIKSRASTDFQQVVFVPALGNV